MSRLPVGILILARDEELNLPDCLHSVIGWAEQVVVLLDPRTSDASRGLSIGAGAEVVEHPFENYADQKNWAFESVNWRSPWILIVDADERVPPDFLVELRHIVTCPHSLEGYALRKKFVFYGQWIRHCWYSSWDLRLFRRGRARYEPRAVHEHMVLDGRLGFFRAGLIHNDFKDLHAWISKHNRYATLEAEEVEKGHKEDALEGRLFGTRLERRRFLKETIWSHLPFRPLLLFLYLYFFKLGILDGRLGLRFCIWRAIFDAFITGKVWEKRLLSTGKVRNVYRQELERHLLLHPEDASLYPPLKSWEQPL